MTDPLSWVLVALAVVSVVYMAVELWRLRRDRFATRTRPSVPARPDPELVERPFDPSLCAYCDDPQRAACPACTRPLCGMHRPWLAHQFCAGCVREWAAGSRRRAFVLVPPMLLVAGAIAAALVLAMPAPDSQLRGAGGSIVILVGGVVPLYFWIERLLRRRFRPTGMLPPASLRR